MPVSRWGATLDPGSGGCQQGEGSPTGEGEGSALSGAEEGSRSASWKMGIFLSCQNCRRETLSYGERVGMSQREEPQERS